MLHRSTAFINNPSCGVRACRIYSSIQEMTDKNPHHFDVCMVFSMVTFCCDPEHFILWIMSENHVKIKLKTEWNLQFSPYVISVCQYWLELHRQSDITSKLHKTELITSHSSSVLLNPTSMKGCNHLHSSTSDWLMAGRSGHWQVPVRSHKPSQSLAALSMEFTIALSSVCTCALLFQICGVTLHYNTSVQVS